MHFERLCAVALELAEVDPFDDATFMGKVAQTSAGTEESGRGIRRAGSLQAALQAAGRTFSLVAASCALTFAGSTLSSTFLAVARGCVHPLLPGSCGISRRRDAAHTFSATAGPTHDPR